MKKINFLNKLRKEGKLDLVEASEEIKESYILKSRSNLISSKILLENNQLEESIALTYYSMYHMLTALLFKAGIKCENHAGSIILLKELFELDNSDILLAKSERIDKQYYTGFHIQKEDVLKAIKSAEEFNRKILDFTSKINTDKMKVYRKKFDEII
ncbi:MAG: HEPN domain-containing protein [Ignavibacteria bacterium]|nr:HEPN domain-containing protein [Ignavibacteria bacterium]